MILTKRFTYKEIVEILTSHINASLNTTDNKLKFYCSVVGKPLPLAQLRIEVDIDAKVPVDDKPR